MRFAVVPAYQPDETLLGIVDELLVRDTNTIIVDDGSYGESQAIIDNLSAKASSEEKLLILRHSENKGKGAAIKTAIKYLSENYESSIVVTVDADGQHDVSDAVSLLSTNSEQFDMLLGQRTFDGDIPLRSKFGNLLTILLFMLFTGKRIPDTQTGMRVFKSDIYHELLAIKGMRYEWEFAVLLKFVRENRKIISIPIKTIYEPGNPSSHFRKVVDSVRIYKQFFSFSLIGLISAFVDYILFIGLLLLGVSNVLSLLIAKIASSYMNFTFLKTGMGFRKDNSLFKPLLRYYLLVGLNFCIIGTVIGNIDNSILDIVSIRIGMEAILFLINFHIIKKIIFN